MFHSYFAQLLYNITITFNCKLAFVDGVILRAMENIVLLKTGGISRYFDLTHFSASKIPCHTTQNGHFSVKIWEAAIQLLPIPGVHELRLFGGVHHDDLNRENKNVDIL